MLSTYLLVERMVTDRSPVLLKFLVAPGFVGFLVVWYSHLFELFPLFAVVFQFLAWFSFSQAVLTACIGKKRFSRARFYGFTVAFIVIWTLGALVAQPFGND